MKSFLDLTSSKTHCGSTEKSQHGGLEVNLVDLVGVFLCELKMDEKFGTMQV